MDRTKALARALLWGMAAALLLVPSKAVLATLDFTPSGISNRLVEVCIALPLGFLVVASVPCVIRSVRWFLLTGWPGRLAIIAGENEIVMRLGSFGTRVYDAKRMIVSYPSELAEEEDGFEALLPLEDQRATLLPRMIHPSARTPINRLILCFAGGSESELAATLRPIIDRWWRPRRAESDRLADSTLEDD